jgi:hypothetical protein
VFQIPEIFYMVPNKYWRWCIVSPLIAFALQHRNIAFLQRHSFLIENFQSKIVHGPPEQKGDITQPRYGMKKIWFGRMNTFLILRNEKR